MPKFLIIRFSSIGDIIQCMGIIDGIREHFPDAEIHWIARKDMSSFLAMDKRIGKIWAFDKALGLKGLLKIARQLREEHYDYIYDAHSNIRSNILRLKLLPWWSKGPHFTLRSKERWKRFLLFNWGINRFPWPFRGVVSYRKPLLKWGIDRFPDTYDDWYFPENFPEKLNSRIQAHTITLVPSANWIKKRWPVEHWKKLITLLSEYHFLILAGPGDTFCEEIRTEAPERVENLAGKTTLLESCYLIHRSHIVSVPTPVSCMPPISSESRLWPLSARPLSVFPPVRPPRYSRPPCRAGHVRKMEAGNVKKVFTSNVW